MQALLLDTHAFLWGLRDAPELSAKARAVLGDPAVIKHLSLASVWEMSIKLGLKRLQMQHSLEDTVVAARQAGVRLMPVDLTHIYRVEILPSHHRDPFDRMLVAQSQALGMPLLSKDQIFDAYGVTRLWA